MSTNYVRIPLFSDPDYEYTISINRVAYKIRMYYNRRKDTWVMDFRYANNDPIVLGHAVIPQYPIFIDYNIPNFDGFFWLEPVGYDKNETVSNPYEIYKYYKLYAYYYTPEE